MFLLIYNFVSGLPVGAFSTKPTWFCKVLRKQLNFLSIFLLTSDHSIVYIAIFMEAALAHCRWGFFEQFSSLFSTVIEEEDHKKVLLLSYVNNEVYTTV